MRPPPRVPPASAAAATPSRARSIGAVRAKPLAALLLGLLAAGARSRPAASPGARAGASAVRARARRLATCARRPPRAAGRASPPRSPRCCTPARSPKRVYRQYYAAYTAAKRSLGRLTRHARASSSARCWRTCRRSPPPASFTASRLPALFLTLERNRQWWTTEPLLSSGERVSFPPSKLVWEYYAGPGHRDPVAGHVRRGQRLLPLRPRKRQPAPARSAKSSRSPRSAPAASPGSTCSASTAACRRGPAASRRAPRLQVLARAWSRFKEPAYLTAAQQALGIFQTAPPQGVRVTHAGRRRRTPSTPTRPSDRILNGFIQALVGLYDYTADHQGPARPAAVRSRRRRGARRGAPLRHRRLVAVRPVRRIEPQLPRTADRIPAAPVRTHAQGPAAAARRRRAARADDPTTTPTTTTARPRHRRPAAPARQRRRAGAASAHTPPRAIAGDQIYCTTAQRFTDRPAHAAGDRAAHAARLRGGTRAGVQMSLSKISTVHADRPPGLAGGVDEPRDASTRAARSCCGSTPAGGGTLLGHAHRDATSPATSPPPAARSRVSTISAGARA